MGIGVKPRESNEVRIKAKDKRRSFTQRATETQRTQRREGGKGKRRGHDVSCPYAGMVFCYDYA
jgi:hypothetical protein